MQVIDEGAVLRDQGIADALRNANNNRPDWQASAYAFFLEFARRHGFFITDEVARYAYSKGLCHPPDGRAWGGITRKAMSDGWIAHAGYKSATNPRHHKCPVNVWKSLYLAKKETEVE